MTDTIAAIASGNVHSGIGIVRISGPEALCAADRVIRLKKGVFSRQEPRRVCYARAVDGETVLDEVVAFWFHGPASFTGEDVVEIQGHGGPFVMRRILEAVLKAGARMAAPGEFSERAFLNGRMDLSQAEAVMRLIHAESEYGRRTAVEQLSGSVRDEIVRLRGKILSPAAYLEAALDDPEHMDLDGFVPMLSAVLEEVSGRIGELIASADKGRVLSEGIRTVILGRPNAGKSSLLNLLSGYDRAIVTEIPGTTRDVLEETVRVGDTLLRLIDTAGLRDTEDRIEQIGVERARLAAQEADLILYLIDATEADDGQDQTILEGLAGRKRIILLNKSDLTDRGELGRIRDRLSAEYEVPVIVFSVRDGTGAEELKSTVLSLFADEDGDRSGTVTICELRHKEALIRAENSLQAVRQSISDGMPEDLFAGDLMAAYRDLGEIIGEEVGEDLINEIFSRFCLGK